MEPALAYCLFLASLSLLMWAYLATGKNRTIASSPDPYWFDYYLLGLLSLGVGFGLIGLAGYLQKTSPFSNTALFIFPGIFGFLTIFYFIITWLLAAFTPLPFFGPRPTWWKHPHHTLHTWYKQTTKHHIYATRTYQLPTPTATTTPTIHELAAYTNTRTSYQTYLHQLPSSTTHKYTRTGTISGPFTFTNTPPAHLINPTTLTQPKTLYYPAEPDLSPTNTRAVELFIDNHTITAVQNAKDDYLKRHTWIWHATNITTQHLTITKNPNKTTTIAIGDPTTPHHYTFTTDTRRWNNHKATPHKITKALTTSRFRILYNLRLFRPDLPEHVPTIEPTPTPLLDQTQYFTNKPITDWSFSESLLTPQESQS